MTDKHNLVSTRSIYPGCSDSTDAPSPKNPSNLHCLIWPWLFCLSALARHIPFKSCPHQREQLLDWWSLRLCSQKQSHAHSTPDSPLHPDAFCSGQWGSFLWSPCSPLGLDCSMAVNCLAVFCLSLSVSCPPCSEHST